MDRRNDLGHKITFAILIAVVSMFLTIIFMKTYNLAEAANKRSYENDTDIAVLFKSYEMIEQRLELIDIKLDRILNGGRR